MTHGDNNAKQIVIDQATDLAKKLQNGNAGCVDTQGKAIGLIVKMITPLYKASFVTTNDCKKLRQESHPDIKRHIKSMRVKVGPVEVEGPLVGSVITNIVPVMCCCAIVYVIGKVHNWW